MKIEDFVTSFVKAWDFARSETLEILDSLDDKKLQFRPAGEKWQTLYWEFGCLGRTQLVYSKAIKESKMDFSWFNSKEMPNKDKYQTKQDIRKFLEEADKSWRRAILSKRRDENFKVVWPGFKMSLPNHISALISHERLHHGQFISYFTLAGFDLPRGFKTNWAL